MIRCFLHTIELLVGMLDVNLADKLCASVGNNMLLVQFAFDEYQQYKYYRLSAETNHGIFQVRRRNCDRCDNPRMDCRRRISRA